MYLVVTLNQETLFCFLIVVLNVSVQVSPGIRIKQKLLYGSLVNEGQQSHHLTHNN